MGLLQKLLGSATGQLIDVSGKSRVWFFADGVCLVVPPMTPLDLPTKTKQTRAEWSVVKKFCEKVGFTIDQIAVASDQVVGAIIGSEIGMINGAYIPLIPRSKKKDDPPETTSTDLGLDGVKERDLAEYRVVRKAALVLQAYVLFTYSTAPETFDIPKKGFTILSGLEAESFADVLGELDNRLYYENNSIIYDERMRIKVPDRETRNRLIHFLEAKLLKEPRMVHSYYQNSTIPEAYQSISDFKSVPQQLVFINRTGLDRWISAQRKERPMQAVVSLTPKDITGDHPDPILYFVEARLIVIQHTHDHSRKGGLYISAAWSEEKQNFGYRTRGRSQKKYTKVIESSKVSIATLSPGVGATYHISGIDWSADLHLLKLGRKRYASILPIEEL